MAKTDANKRHTAEFYRRKCHDLMLELKQMRTAFGQVNEAMDATLIEIAMKFGVKVRDKDAKGWRKPVIGYRVELPPPDPGKLMDYEVATQKNKNGAYVVGVIKRKESERSE